MRNGAEDPRFGAQSQEVNRSQVERGLRQNSAVTAVVVHGRVLLHFWCEFNLQSMNKRKGSGWTPVAIF